MSRSSTVSGDVHAFAGEQHSVADDEIVALRLGHRPDGQHHLALELLQLLVAPQVEVLPELLLGAAKVALSREHLALEAHALGIGHDRAVADELVLEGHELALHAQDLLVDRRELGLDPLAGLLGLGRLVENPCDVHEPDHELGRRGRPRHRPHQGDGRPSVPSHHAVQTGEAAPRTGQARANPPVLVRIRVAPSRWQPRTLRPWNRVANRIHLRSPAALETSSEAAPRTDEPCSKPPDLGRPPRLGGPVAASCPSSMKPLCESDSSASFRTVPDF